VKIVTRIQYLPFKIRNTVMMSIKEVFRIRIQIGSGFTQANGSASGFGYRIRIQEGKNPTKIEKKLRNFMY
jgi:hypothetical protein